jgi:putative nucleotidyltransferase with HDIG domain
MSEDGLQSKYVSAIKAYIAKMPSLPVTVTKIMEICNDPRTSPADLNKIISIDPVLMGNVMKLINSAYYGISQEITSLVRAIIMLGINTVKNLALSTAVLGNLGDIKNFQALNMDGFWRHSLCVGVTSKLIAKKRKVDPKKLEEYFIAGLLHDIGKIPLNNRLPEQYIEAMSLSDREHLSLVDAEKRAIGLDHAVVGRLIGEAWKLTAEIREAIEFHHVPEAYEGEHTELVFTVSLANYFANYFEIGFSGDRFPVKPDPKISQTLKVTMDDLEDIEDTVNQEIEKARIFLQIN